jgi:hypothetical protein
VSAGTGTGPNLGLASSVEQLITGLETIRDTLRDDTESAWTRQMVSQLAFEEHHDPSGIRAQIWGMVVDGFTRMLSGPVVIWILEEAHRQYGIQGAVQSYDNTSWLFRWDDQG